MSDAWADMASDSYQAADELFASGRWRSAISRAYYAGYSIVSARLRETGQTMPDRGNWGHYQIQNLLWDGMM